MSIYRVHKNTDYTTINNKFLKRKDLSWKAKGILAYLLSLPDDWELHFSELKKNATDGKTSTRSGLDELKEEGYIIYTKTRDEEGKFVHNYDIYEEPQSEKPDTENQDTENQATDNRDLLLNTNELNTNKQSTNRSNNNDIVPKEEIEKIYNELPPYWESLFEDYIDIYRAENKTNKITDNKHLRLLKEIKDIFERMKFGYNRSNYDLTEEIFEQGLIKIIEKGVANLNYAKKVWISAIENKEGGNNGKRYNKHSGTNKGKAKGTSEEGEIQDIFNTG